MNDSLSADHSTQFLQQIKTLQTELSKEKTTRKKAEYKLNTVLNSVVDAIVSIDENGTVTSYNKAAVNIFGYDMGEVVGNKVSLLMPEDYRCKHETGLDRYNKSGESSVIGRCREVVGLHKNGKNIPIELTVGELNDDNDRQYIGVIRDISERKEAAQRIEHMALHDPLTKLPNRNMLNVHLEHALNRAKRTHTDMALLFIDLDQLKPINDSYGHSAGDYALTEISERFRKLIRNTDIVARVGGDEFVVILEVINGRDNAAMLAERFLCAVNEPLIYGDHHFKIGASIGISLFPDNGSSHKTLVDAADSAMYAVKKNGRNSYRFFYDSL